MQQTAEITESKHRQKMDRKKTAEQKVNDTKLKGWHESNKMSTNEKENDAVIRLQ